MQPMAGDGIVQSDQEYIAVESDSTSTSYWLRTGWSYIAMWKPFITQSN